MKYADERREALLKKLLPPHNRTEVAGQRYWSRLAARRDVTKYIEMEYNSCRLHSTLGYQTPREIELAAAT